MSWLRIDDGFADNVKVSELSDRAFRLHVEALCYCSRNLTDGWLLPKTVKVLTAGIGATRKHVDELIEKGLWLNSQGGGFTVNDYLEYNPSAEQVKATRKDLSAKRSDAGRKGAAARWKQTDGNGDGKPDGKHGKSHMAPSPPVLKTKSKTYLAARYFNDPTPIGAAASAIAAQAVQAKTQGGNAA